MRVQFYHRFSHIDLFSEQFSVTQPAPRRSGYPRAEALGPEFDPRLMVNFLQADSLTGLAPAERQDRQLKKVTVTVTIIRQYETHREIETKTLGVIWV